MAAANPNQGVVRPRPLPRLIPLDPAGASSEDTPRTANSDESARQRRRTQQRLARLPTSDGRESASPPSAVTKDFPMPPRSTSTNENPTSKRRKARRRVPSSSPLTQESSLLKGFEDEVVIERSKKARESFLLDPPIYSPHGNTVAGQSALSARIFYEEKKKFSSTGKDNAERRVDGKPGQTPYSIGLNNNYTFQQQTAEVLKRYTVQVAKQTHTAFQRFFLFIHGLNSGYALWICIFVYVFTTGDNASTFFNIYRSIALITHLLFYLFLALCIVDILDRVDPVKFNRTVLFESISLQNSALALIFYTIAMVINLAMMPTEDYLRMSQYATNGTNQTFLAVKDVVDNQASLWKQLTAVRTAFIIAGWFIVSMHVKKDRLSTMIKNTEDKAFYEELNIEQNTTPTGGGGATSA